MLKNQGLPGGDVDSKSITALSVSLKVSILSAEGTWDVIPATPGISCFFSDPQASHPHGDGNGQWPFTSLLCSDQGDDVTWYVVRAQTPNQASSMGLHPCVTPLFSRPLPAMALPPAWSPGPAPPGPASPTLLHPARAPAAGHLRQDWG